MGTMLPSSELTKKKTSKSAYFNYPDLKLEILIIIVSFLQIIYYFGWGKWSMVQNRLCSLSTLQDHILSAFF